jgi:hypothetical protein
VAVLASTAVHATTISFNDTYGPVAVPAAPAVLANLQQFDPALGTLTKVTLTLDADAFAGQIDWDNEALIVTDVTLGIGAQVTATGLAGATAIAVPLQLGSAIGVAADNDGAPDFVGTDSFSVIGGIGNDVDSDILVAGLGPYIGIGTFGVTVGAVVQPFLSTSGGFGPLQPYPGSTDGTVTVTYEFTPIPEPGTALLFSGGMLGLAVAGRRRAR